MLTMWVYPRDVWNDRFIYVGVWHLGTNRLRLSTSYLSCRKMGNLSHAWRDLEWGLSPNLSCVSVRGGLSGHCKCSLLPRMVLQWWVHVSNGTVAQRLKRLPAMQETWVRSLGWKIPWRRKWQPTPVLLPGESHGWRSLVSYSPRGCKASETTERLHFHFQWQDEPFKGTHQKLLIMLEHTYILDILMLIYWVGHNVSSVCSICQPSRMCISVTIYVAIQPTLTEK